MEPSLSHARGNLLLIQKMGNGPGALSSVPMLENFLDYPIFFRVYDKLAIQPVVAVREDWRTHFRGLPSFLFWTSADVSKCIAMGRESFADGGFCETSLRFYLA